MIEMRDIILEESFIESSNVYRKLYARRHIFFKNRLLYSSHFFNYHTINSIECYLVEILRYQKQKKNKQKHEHSLEHTYTYVEYGEWEQNRECCKLPYQHFTFEKNISPWYASISSNIHKKTNNIQTHANLMFYAIFRDFNNIFVVNCVLC